VKRRFPYGRGRYREYKVRDFLRNVGLFVVRCAGSRPVDLVILRNGKSMLVEVKARPYLSPSERVKLWNVAEQSGSPVYLAVWGKGRLTLYHVAGKRDGEFERLLVKGGRMDIENLK